MGGAAHFTYPCDVHQRHRSQAHAVAGSLRRGTTPNGAGIVSNTVSVPLPPSQGPVGHVEHDLPTYTHTRKRTTIGCRHIWSA